MIRKYFLNFWLWWYGIALKNVFGAAFSLWSLSLATLNLLPMLSNLFTPMFQDKSITGKFISFIIRIQWVLFGSILQLILTVPLVLVVIIWILLPIATLVQIFRFFI